MLNKKNTLFGSWWNYILRPCNVFCTTNAVSDLCTAIPTVTANQEQVGHSSSYSRYVATRSATYFTLPRLAKAVFPIESRGLQH